MSTGLYASDGSYNVVIDTGSGTAYSGGKGIYAVNGSLRINTTDTGPGLYAKDGAYRGSISASEVSPPAGTGAYTPSGAYRLTKTGSAYYLNDGLYAKDGSFKVTVGN